MADGACEHDHHRSKGRHIPTENPLLQFTKVEPITPPRKNAKITEALHGTNLINNEDTEHTSQGERPGQYQQTELVGEIPWKPYVPQDTQRRSNM